MENTYVNVISALFDKIFRRIFNIGKNIELEYIPYKDLLDKAFMNESVHKIISSVSLLPEIFVREYISDKKFIREYLFDKMKKKRQINIMMDEFNYDDAYEKYHINYIKIALINNHKSLVKFLIDKVMNNAVCPISLPTPNHLFSCEMGTDLLKLNREECIKLMMLAVEYSDSEIYIDLLKLFDSIGIVIEPNIHVYNKAIIYANFDVVKMIDDAVSPSPKTLEYSFSSYHDENIMFMIEKSEEENLTIRSEWFTDLIKNEKIELLEKIRSKLKIETTFWKPEHYYAAILSGNMNVVKYMEGIMNSNLHSSRILDSSKNKRGKRSILMDEMKYLYEGKTYFSHTMNYAVLSNSLQMVKYFKKIGYGITLSNIINSIKKSNDQILTYLIECFQPFSLPDYLIAYFSFNSFSLNKIYMGKILYDSGFKFFNQKSSRNLKSYKNQSIHSEIISNEKVLLIEPKYDIDYVLDYDKLFSPYKNKTNENIYINTLITKLRLSIQLNLDIMDLISNIYDMTEKQLIVDIVFLFGRKCYIDEVLSSLKIYPSIQIIIEVICYGRIDKINSIIDYIIHNREIFEEVKKVAIIMQNELLFKVLNIQIENILEDSSYDNQVIESRNKNLIIKFLQKRNMENMSDDQIINILYCFCFDYEPIKNLINNQLLQDILQRKKISEWIINSELYDLIKLFNKT